MSSDGIPQPYQTEMLDRILAIGQAIQQHILENPKKVYQLIVEAACEMTGADCAVIYPYHPSFSGFYDIENVAAHGFRYELGVEKGANQRKGLAARVHQMGEIICENIEDATYAEACGQEETPLIAREEIKAFMGLSLKVGGNILGILYVDYRQPHRFSAVEKRTIRLLGQQAAGAVSSSWTSRLADMRAGTVARLKTVGQTVVAVEDPSRTLDSVLTQIAHSRCWTPTSWICINISRLGMSLSYHLPWWVTGDTLTCYQLGYTQVM